MKGLTRPSVFFGLILLLTFLQVRYGLGLISFQPGSLTPYLWIASFAILAFNISILAAQSFLSLFAKTVPFAKVDPSLIRSVPVALLYCIKNESFGLRERIRYTLRGNLTPGLQLWILSDSDQAREEEEREMAEGLRAEFGEEKVFYRRRKVPLERKQGNLKEWLFQQAAPFRYFVVCDADSLLPRGWLEEMLAIAEHPDHSRVGIFQSAVYVTHEDSLYSRIQAVGQFYAQRFYFPLNQALFGRSISFGHNQLIRKEAFEKIELPEGILSHDNWDTALLEREGYRTVFLPDLVSFEEAPPHYLEERRRARRWLKGSLQGWPLLFLPGISFSTRFLIFYQIYLYLVKPVLLFWTVTGLYAATSLGDELFTGKGGALSLLGATLAVLFFHKLPVVNTLQDVGRILKESLFSTLLGLQNVFYGTLDLLTLPLERIGWVPMSKNPDERPTFRDCVENLLPGTLAGMVFLYAGLKLSPLWTLYTLPLILSLMLSIPLVYGTSRRCREVLQPMADFSQRDELSDEPQQQELVPVEVNV